MDNRQRKAKFNAATMLLNQLVATLCGMLIPWIMIDTFGSEAYGATTSIAQFLSYISILEGGIGRAARGELYKPLAEGDTGNISRVYLAIKRFFNGIGTAFCGYAVILAFCYYDIADVGAFSRDYIFWLVIVMTIGKLAEFMGGYSNITLFNADQRQYVSNLTVIGTSLVNVLLVVVLSNAGCDLLWVKLGSSLVFVLKPVIYAIYRKKHYVIIRTKERTHLKNQWTAIGQHIAYFIQNNIPIFTLTVFANLKAVAVYSVYHLIGFSLRNVVTSFGSGMEAMFGNMIAREEMEELNKAYRRYKWTLTVLTLALFGTAMILIVPFVKLYTADVTDANYRQPVFAGVLLLAEAVYCLILPCYNLPIAAAKLKESRVGAYGEAIVSVVVSIALVFWNPLLAVSIGMLVSMLFKGVYLTVFCARNILCKNPRRLLRDFFGSVMVLAIMACGGIWLANYLLIENYLVWALHGVVAVVAMGFVAVLIGCVQYPGVLKFILSGLFKHRNTEK